MTTKELVLSQLNITGNQLTKVLENLPAGAEDTQISPAAMTPRQIVGHLCECYTAYDEISQGKAHSWGSYQAPELPMMELISHMQDLRNRAVQIVEGTDVDEHFNEAMAYISNHDSYHIGQLALARIQSDPTWDPYSLYQ